jgi:hypothetical protein
VAPAPPAAPRSYPVPDAALAGGAAAGARPVPGGMVPPPRSAGRGSGDGGSGRNGTAPPPSRPGAARPGSARTEHRRWGLARVAIRPAAASGEAQHSSSAATTLRPPPQAQAKGTQAKAAQAKAAQARAVQARAAQAKAAQAKIPWYEIAEGNRTAEGWRDCGTLESVLHREWEQTGVPPPEAVTAINRLADLPRLIKDRLVAGLDAIHVGGGGVPDLDDMGRLSGVPLPSGRATWDACAGAYGERKIVVGSRPSPTPDVMCHEVGHALDDIDGPTGHWQSDSDEFYALYDQCLPHLVSNLHRQRGILGRREFFADAFAAIASRQRPALVDMLGGDTRAALNVMLYFNVRYGI